MKKILVAGPTGLIGSTVLEQLAGDPTVHAIALTRRPLPTSLPRVEQWQAPGDDLMAGLRNEAVDAVICCLGTTIRKAGSRDKFRYVDHDLVVGLGQWATRQKVPAFSVVSAIGADAGSGIFYNRVKGEMEQELKALGLPSLHIFHPSILAGPRQETRIGERAGIVVMSMLAPLMIGGMQRYRPMPHDVLAKALIRSVLSRDPGTHYYTYKEIVALAGTT
jgi:uncharacterized protein YbjT (DUF2867 family)